MSRKGVNLGAYSATGEVASNQKPQQEERTGGVPGGVKKSAFYCVLQKRYAVLVFGVFYSLGMQEYFGLKLDAVFRIATPILFYKWLVPQYATAFLLHPNYTTFFSLVTRVGSRLSEPPPNYHQRAQS